MLPKYVYYRFAAIYVQFDAGLSNNGVYSSDYSVEWWLNCFADSANVFDFK